MTREQRDKETEGKAEKYGGGGHTRENGFLEARWWKHFQEKAMYYVKCFSGVKAKGDSDSAITFSTLKSIQ